MRVVLGGLGDRALGLRERELGGIGRLRQRPAERADQETVGLLAEWERGRLARVAHDSARGGGKALQMLGFTAVGARRQLWQDAGGEQ